MKRVMITCILALVLTTSISNCVIAQNGNSGPCDSCAMMADLLRTLHNIHPGTTRQQVEQDFELDGGPHYTPQSRYRFKKCGYIKINVDFTGNEKDSKPGFVSSDRVTKISQPYIETPFED